MLVRTLNYQRIVRIIVGTAVKVFGVISTHKQSATTADWRLFVKVKEWYVDGLLHKRMTEVYYHRYPVLHMTHIISLMITPCWQPFISFNFYTLSVD